MEPTNLGILAARLPRGKANGTSASAQGMSSTRSTGSPSANRQKQTPPQKGPGSAANQRGRNAVGAASSSPQPKAETIAVAMTTSNEAPATPVAANLLEKLDDGTITKSNAKSAEQARREKAVNKIYKRKDPTIREVFRTAWLFLKLSQDTACGFCCSVLQLIIMSISVICMTAAQYAFPMLMGEVMLVATSPQDDVSLYAQAVKDALTRPLVLALILTFVMLVVQYNWFLWRFKTGRQIRARIYAMLVDCDKTRFELMIDTPSERLLPDLIVFLQTYASDGIIHKVLEIITQAAVGITIVGTLLGTRTTLFVVGYALFQTILEAWCARLLLPCFPVILLRVYLQSQEPRITPRISLF